MALNVVVQPPDLGGFSVVSIQLKVYSLLMQWVKRLLVSPNGWTYLLKYWLLDCFSATPFEVFALTFDYVVETLPSFYYALFTAWCALQGSSVSSVLMVSTDTPYGPISVASISCKISYQPLLPLHEVQPHCVLQFAPSFGTLDWSATWRSLQFMPLDRQVRDLGWKVAHGALYTADHLTSFGYQYLPSCFCGYHLECPEHLFFSCPLAHSGLDWIQSQLFLASPLAPPLSVRHVNLVFHLMICCVFPGSLLTCLMCVSFLFGNSEMIFGSIQGTSFVPSF